MEVIESEEDGFILLSNTDHVSTQIEQSCVPKYMCEISTCIDNLRGTLWPLNRYIHDNPELAFQEHKAHDALTTFMESQQGWEVRAHAYEIDTAWEAVFDTGRKGPTVSFNAEMGQSSFRLLFSNCTDTIVSYAQMLFRILAMPAATI